MYRIRTESIRSKNFFPVSKTTTVHFIWPSCNHCRRRKIFFSIFSKTVRSLFLLYCCIGSLSSVIFPLLWLTIVASKPLPKSLVWWNKNKRKNRRLLPQYSRTSQPGLFLQIYYKERNRKTNFSLFFADTAPMRTNKWKQQSNRPSWFFADAHKAFPSDIVWWITKSLSYIMADPAHLILLLREYTLAIIFFPNIRCI